LTKAFWQLIVDCTMNDKVVNDLKKFITTTVREEVSGFATKADLANFATKSDIVELREEMNERFDENYTTQNEILNVIGGFQDAQTRALSVQADHIDDHGLRLVKLESR